MLPYIFNCVKDAVLPNSNFRYRIEVLLFPTARCIGYWWLTSAFPTKELPFVKVIHFPREQYAFNDWFVERYKIPIFVCFNLELSYFSLEQLCRTNPDPGLLMGCAKVSAAIAPQLNFSLHLILFPATFQLALFYRMLLNKPHVYKFPSQGLFPKNPI